LHEIAHILVKQLSQGSNCAGKPQIADY